jgi:hypothetical protein
MSSRKKIQVLRNEIGGDLWDTKEKIALYKRLRKLRGK